MEIKQVAKEEIASVMEIIADAKELLSHQSDQWQQGYPDEARMMQDIENGNLYGVYEAGQLLGVECLIFGLEPSYVKIDNGSWDCPAGKGDLVIHRIAVRSGQHGKHLGDELMAFADRHARTLHAVTMKADTHRANKGMQRLLEKAGFRLRGIITLARDEMDNTRLAYEKVL